MKIEMTNPKTGEVKEIKVGWSWILFLFSSFFGLPLFLRRLYIWGGILLSLGIVYIIAPSMMYDEEESLGLIIVLNLVFLGLQIWLGIKGNEMTAKNYLELGWHFTNPNSDEVKFAKGKWGINI
ncbi:hypothetical protein [Arcobacter defluvii]|uniref:Membrane protein n=1 Tax=Arcobacter defluvii TaxID=873191 RepID=A0AAE7BGP1_9BACT|nr:hypothetical protein [Arcobacter defluvii]QKF78228.1 putative membrane protein [Arcobacter defluvii]RXI33333.1 hypothetical protein CP964_07105 [Arcobacter defluvii]